MATLRKAAAYSKKYARPYTRRSKKKSKAYIKTVPPQSIVKFDMGNQKMLEEGKLPYVLHMITTEDIQIRSNAIEACRQYVNKKLEKVLPGQYHFKIPSYPHHIQRENKMLTGAGADRMSTGMQLSFGRTIARAIILKKGEPIFIVATGNKKADSFVRQTLKIIKTKLPCKTSIIGQEVREQEVKV